MIQIQQINFEQFAARYRERIARTRDMKPPLTTAGALAVSAAKRIFTGPNGWAPNSPATIARKGSSRPGIDRGTMRASISAGEASESQIAYGTELPYAVYFQRGTGTYAGHSKWRTRSRYSRLNASMGVAGIRTEGRLRDGQPARPFMVFDDILKQRIRKVFADWVALRPLEDGG